MLTVNVSDYDQFSDIGHSQEIMMTIIKLYGFV